LMSSGRLMKVRQILKKISVEIRAYYCMSANEIYLTVSPRIHFPSSTLSKYELKKSYIGKSE
jgi:hypothetical protein